MIGGDVTFVRQWEIFYRWDIHSWPTAVAAAGDGTSIEWAGGGDDHVLSSGFHPLHTYWDDQRGIWTL